MSTPDTILMTQGLASVQSDNVLITVNGTQATLANQLHTLNGGVINGGTITAPLTNSSTIIGGSLSGNILASPSITGLATVSVQDAITASTTQTLAGATKLTGAVCNITTVATAGDAVGLAPASASTIGQQQHLFNNGASAASVFPGEAGTKVDGGSAGAAVTLTNAKNAQFVQNTATSWLSYQGGAASA